MTIRFLPWLAVMACGGAAPSVVRFRDAAHAHELRLSATGNMVAFALKFHDRDEVRLRQRGPDNRQVATGTGTIVGVPNERDVLVVDGERIRWLRDARDVAHGLPAESSWRLIVGSVDHAANIATLAFVTDEGAAMVKLIEVDTAAMRVRATQDLAATAPASCRASGTGSTVYVWCLESTDNVERWRITRHDGAKTTWECAIEMPRVAGRTDVRGAVTGDGSALVLMHGEAETRRERFSVKRVIVVDARAHRTRDLRTSEPLYSLDELVPVPGRPAVAYARWGLVDYDGIVVVDARAETVRVAVPPDRNAVPLVLAVQPDGRFLIP